MLSAKHFLPMRVVCATGFPAILQHRRTERIAADVGESRRNVPGVRSWAADPAQLPESAAAAAS